VALLVTIASLRTARASFQQARTTLITQIRNEWVKLHHDWTTSITLANGPEDYYSGATAEQRAEIRGLAEDATLVGFPESQQLVFSYHRHVKQVTEMLDLCAIVVLQGRLSVSDIYAIFGLDVARQGRAVRWMLGVHPAEWANPHPEDRAGIWLEPVVDDHSFARQQRILALVDLLWSHACRTGDLSLHTMMAAAVHKRDHSGTHNLHRVRRLAHGWKNARHGFRLQAALLHGHFISSESIRHQSHPMLGPVYWDVVRIGLWRMRALRQVIRSLLLPARRFELLRMQLVGWQDGYGHEFPPRWRRQ